MKLRNLTADRRPRKVADRKQPAVPQQGPRAGHEQPHLVPHLPPRPLRALHRFEKDALPERDPQLAHQLRDLLKGNLKSAKAAVRRHLPRPGQVQGPADESIEPAQEPADTPARAAPSRRADLAFAAASVAVRHKVLPDLKEALLGPGGKLPAAPPAHPVAPDLLPDKTMPGAFPVEAPEPAVAAGRMERAVGRLRALPTQALATAGQASQRASMAAAVTMGQSLARGAMLEATSAMARVEPAPRGDTLMPGTFPGTQARLEAELTAPPGDDKAAPRGGRQALADARDQAAFRAAVATGRLIVRGGTQALERKGLLTRAPLPATPPRPGDAEHAPPGAWVD